MYTQLILYYLEIFRVSTVILIFLPTSFELRQTLTDKQHYLSPRPPQDRGRQPAGYGGEL